MKLSIIIVAWNVRDVLSDCLNSITQSLAAFPYEIIVVDNASTDGTADHIKNKFPAVRLVENKANQGFAAANNQGAAIANGQYLLILNPDTILFDHTLSKMVDFMDSNPAIAMCGPHILNEDKSLQKSVRNFPSWRGAFYRYTVLKYMGLFKSHFTRWHNRQFDYDKQADVEQIIGAAMLIRKEIFEKIGRFDERFFMYYEEVDLCKRLKDCGFRVVYCPDIQLIHLGGKSAKQIPAKTRYMSLQSLLRYFKRHSSYFAYCVLSMLLKLGVLSRQLYEMIVFFVGFLFCRLFENRKKAADFELKYRAAAEFLSKYYLKFLFC